MNKITIGAYQHFKGGHVNVLLTAEHSEVKEELVVYQGLNNGKYYARPIESFCAVVDGTPRFEKVENNQAPIYEGALPESKIPVGRYKNANNELLDVLFTAKHSDREEIEVIYKELKAGNFFATPLEKFIAKKQNEEENNK